MVHISINKGLDIPIEGKPTGTVQDFIPLGESFPSDHPLEISLNLDPFDDLRFRLQAKEGDRVKVGQPLVEDKATPGRVFASPAGGEIVRVQRGLKRRIVDIVIRVDSKEEYHDFGTLNVDSASREKLLDKLTQEGLFAHIRQRPFNFLASPDKAPRSIFVKAIESAPFVPPAELQVQGNEKDFQTGLDALAKLTDGSVHLVHHVDSTSTAFTQAKNVQVHTAEGPHPIGNQSVHIHYIDPILTPECVVWTVSVLDVIMIGHLCNTGRYFTDRVVSIAGPGVLPDRRGYFKVRAGFPVSKLIAGRIPSKPTRIISGNPLTGQKVDADGFLGFYHTALTAIPEVTEREMFHFLRLGVNKYSFSKAYLSGHFDNSKREYSFTTNQHGEERAFIDPTQYDKVMPLPIPTMNLVKAVMAEDFDLAEELGLLEVDSEDFALSTFVCPSKVEMVDIIRDGLRFHASEVLE